jgi:hypothetical protein
MALFVDLNYQASTDIKTEAIGIYLLLFVQHNPLDAGSAQRNRVKVHVDASKGN